MAYQEFNMKNFIIFTIFLIFIMPNIAIANSNNFFGRWTENNKLVWSGNKNNTDTEFIKRNESSQIKDRYNHKKDYFDYSVVLAEFSKEYYYTTVKINKSKERILIITDEVDENKNSYRGLFYYFAQNGFAYPLGYLESTEPFAQSKDYLYLNDGNNDIKFYAINKKSLTIKTKVSKTSKIRENIEFVTIESVDKFARDFGEPAGDDVKKVTLNGFYFEYHKPQYKKKYIKSLMKECINDGVKTQVQMYCCMVKKLHS